MAGAERDGGPVGGLAAEEGQEVDVLLGSQSERERDDCEIETAHPQGSEPDDAGQGRAEATVVTSTLTQNGTPSKTRRAAKSAPMPANAIWPSDSWPSQPVTTVSEDAQIA